ncbi:MAG: M48 family metallopeptidase [bacterium]
MSTLYTNQRKNTEKTWLLMSLFLVIIVALGYFISTYYGNPSILYFAIFFSIFMNVLSYWYSDKIVLTISGAHPADHDTYTELYHSVENLSITAGLPMPKIYIINDPAPNAFATGRDKNHAVVAVTSGLLQMMNRNELDGVVAHELSHIQNKDILLQTVVVVLVGFIAILANIFLHSSFGFGGRRGSSKDEGSAGNVLMIVGIVFIILSPIVAQLIQLAISRRREFLADASGALLTRYPEGLASALQKISSYSAPMIKANNAMAHMYISSPFGANARKGMTGLFLTHPPVEDRIKALLNK